MKVFSDLKTRGCQDILIAVTDGLKGMSEALAAVFPDTTLQTCIVHLIRHSLDFANWKERKLHGRRAAADLHRGERRGRAAPRLDAFERGPVGHEVSDRRRVLAPRLDARHSVLRVSARRPPSDLHDQCARERARASSRKIIKTRGHFPTDEAATKLIWLALRNILNADPALARNRDADADCERAAPSRSAVSEPLEVLTQAATTLIRPAFRERGFRRITISTSWSSAVNRFIRRSTEKPASL